VSIGAGATLQPSRLALHKADQGDMFDAVCFSMAVLGGVLFGTYPVPIKTKR
jgi:hypothetical protein